jgi:hypothetical protein
MILSHCVVVPLSCSQTKLVIINTRYLPSIKTIFFVAKAAFALTKAEAAQGYYKPFLRAHYVLRINSLCYYKNSILLFYRDNIKYNI